MKSARHIRWRGPSALLDLLAQEVEARDFLCVRFRPRTARRRRRRAGTQNDTTRRAVSHFAHHMFQHLARIVEELLRALAHHLVPRGWRGSAGQLPGAEERRPVDALDQSCRGYSAKMRVPVKGRLRRRVGRPVDWIGVGAGDLERDQLVLLPSPRSPGWLRIRRDLGGEVARLALRGRTSAPLHADRPRGVEHVQRSALRAARCAARCGPARWSRRRSAAAPSKPCRVHFLGHVTISSSDGVIRPDRPIRSARLSLAVSRMS